MNSSKYFAIALVMNCSALLSLQSMARQNGPASVKATSVMIEPGDKFKTYYNQTNEDSLYGMFAPIMVKAITREQTKQMLNQLHEKAGELRSVDLFSHEGDQYRYKAVYANLTMTLLLSMNKDNLLEGIQFLPYNPSAKTAPAPAPADSTNFRYNSTTGIIYGTILIPSTTSGSSAHPASSSPTSPTPAQKVPVVLIIAGSGPTDRNGNDLKFNLQTNCYKMLADSLAKYNIASLRYDKRGIGESSAALSDQSKVTFDDYVDDAIGLIRQLKADKRFSRVIVIGHSEGSLIGMIAARETSADAFISLAGAGDRIDRILERQFAQGGSKELAANAKVLLDSLREGYSVAEPVGDPTLSPLFRTSLQNYLKSWLKYDPRQEIARLKIPVLILQGTTDIQVSLQDARNLKQAKTDATLIEIDQMNHVLKTAPDDRMKNIATYSNLGLPVKTELIQDIVGFIRQ